MHDLAIGQQFVFVFPPAVVSTWRFRRVRVSPFHLRDLMPLPVLGMTCRLLGGLAKPDFRLPIPEILVLSADQDSASPEVGSISRQTLQCLNQLVCQPLQIQLRLRTPDA